MSTYRCRSATQCWSLLIPIRIENTMNYRIGKWMVRNTFSLRYIRYHHIDHTVRRIRLSISRRLNFITFKIAPTDTLHKRRQRQQWKYQFPPSTLQWNFLRLIRRSTHLWIYTRQLIKNTLSGAAQFVVAQRTTKKAPDLFAPPFRQRKHATTIRQCLRSIWIALFFLCIQRWISLQLVFTSFTYFLWWNDKKCVQYVVI